MTSQAHTSRVSAGEYRYKVIHQPKSDVTRPVTQKLRAAIFDTIGHDLSGLTVLDLYAGSGALAMEALSRGASEVTTVEQDRQAQKSIVANERELGVSLGLRELSVEAYLESDTKSYDIIFLDPPYAAFSDDIALEAASHLDDEGVLIISCSASQALPEGLGTASIVKARTYDDTQLAYYKKPAK